MKQGKTLAPEQIFKIRVFHQKMLKAAKSNWPSVKPLQISYTLQRLQKTKKDRKNTNQKSKTQQKHIVFQCFRDSRLSKDFVCFI